MKDRKTNQTTSDEMMERWVRKAIKWKKKGIPLEFTSQQAIMEFDMYRLGVRSEYHQKLEANELQRKEDQEQIQDIKDGYQHFVDAEKLTVQDQVFAKIDKLKARLNTLKSKYNEQRKYKSIIKKLFKNGSEKTV
ncbi:MAG: hypothetical protein AAGA64_12295 [Bacteroidota bacterium]